MDPVLELTADLAEVEIAAGEVLVREGDPGGPIYVLVSGSLRVMKGGMQVNAVTRPGALIGEVSVLLGGSFSATVEAVEPSIVRRALDGAAFLTAHPALMMHVATGLASRLDFVTTYLADLKGQYGDAPGLAMVPEVLKQLASRQAPRSMSGSAREPDPLY